MSRVQPPRKARSEESKAKLRRRQLNLKPQPSKKKEKAEEEASASDSSADLAPAPAGKYQKMVMEAMKTVKTGTATEVINAACKRDQGTSRKSLSVALGLCRRKGLIELDRREYSLSPSKAKSKSKSRAGKVVVAKKTRRPPVKEAEEPNKKKRKAPAAKKKNGTVAKKSLPLTAKKALADSATKNKKKKQQKAPVKKAMAAAKKKAVAAKKPPPAAAKKPRKAPAAPAAPAAAAAPAGMETSGLTAHWEYFDRSWRRYDKEASDRVEELYQVYLKDTNLMDVPSIQSGDWRYMVNFKAMTQTNIDHSSHTTREIRRVDGP
jgi:hypothetical protein